MKLELAVVLALVTSISCNNTPPSPQPVTVTETYDELDPSLLAGTPVGTVHNLTYTAFSLNAVEAVQVGGVKSQSGNNRLVSNVDTQLKNGTPSIAIATSSKYKSFSPLNFYFGCTLFNAVNTALVTEAVQCTVTVAGFVKNNDQEVAVASYTFTPPPSPVAPVPMLHAVLPDSFKQKLFNVTLIQTLPLTTVLLVDSLTYKLNP